MLCSLEGSPGGLGGWTAPVPAPVLLWEDGLLPLQSGTRPFSGTQELAQRYRLSVAHLLNPKSAVKNDTQHHGKLLTIVSSEIEQNTQSLRM